MKRIPTRESTFLLEQSFELALDSIQRTLSVFGIQEELGKVIAHDGEHLIPLWRERQREGDLR